MAEARDPVRDQIRARHALDQTRLPCLIDHVSAALEVRLQARDDSGEVDLLLDRAALGMAELVAIRAGSLNPPDADAAVSTMLFEDPRAGVQALVHARGQRRDVDNGVRIAAERQLARSEEDVLGAEPQDRVRVSADEDTLRRDGGQHRVESPTRTAALDRVVPDENAIELLELTLHFGGEVVAVDRRLRRDAAVSKRLEERREATRVRIRPIARLAIAGIEERNARARKGRHRRLVNDATAM